MNYAFLKYTQFNIQKYITWPKKLGKGTQAWDYKVGKDYELRPRELYTLMKTKYLISLFDHVKKKGKT